MPLAPHTSYDPPIYQYPGGAAGMHPAGAASAGLAVNNHPPPLLELLVECTQQELMLEYTQWELQLERLLLHPSPYL